MRNLYHRNTCLILLNTPLAKPIFDTLLKNRQLWLTLYIAALKCTLLYATGYEVIVLSGPASSSEAVSWLYFLVFMVVVSCFHGCSFLFSWLCFLVFMALVSYFHGFSFWNISSISFFSFWTSSYSRQWQNVDVCVRYLWLLLALVLMVFLTSLSRCLKLFCMCRFLFFVCFNVTFIFEGQC